MRIRLVVAAAVVAALLAGSGRAANLLDSLKKGTPDLKHAGALNFAPEGILLVGDSLGAAVFAIDTGDRPSSPASGPLKVEDLGDKIGGLLGVEAKQVRVNDLAVNPLSGNAYLSVTRGQGDKSQPAIVRVNRSGKIEDLPLKDVAFAKAALPNPPADRAGGTGRGPSPRQETITSLAFSDGKVFIAGLSNEEFSSTLRAIPMPFTEADKGAGIQIFHGAHGRLETNSPVRTFVPYTIDEKPHLLAAYTCTPLVTVPVAELKAGAKVKGTTIAELGNMNRPLDMVPYKKGGKDYVLIANSARGLMKLDAAKFNKAEPITTRIGGTAGVGYEKVPGEGIAQLAKLDDGHALVLKQAQNGPMTLDTIELP